MLFQHLPPHILAKVFSLDVRHNFWQSWADIVGDVPPFLGDLHPSRFAEFIELVRNTRESYEPDLMSRTRFSQCDTIWQCRMTLHDEDRPEMGFQLLCA